MGKATIFISGTVSQMPRYRDVQTKNGTRTVVTITVPVDHGWGERKQTTFYDCDHWMPESEKGVNYLSHVLGKGAKVAIVGEPCPPRPWTGRDGNQHISNPVDVKELDVLCPAPAVEVKDEPREAPSAPQNGSDGLYDESIPF